MKKATGQAEPNILKTQIFNSKIFLYSKSLHKNTFLEEIIICFWDLSKQNILFKASFSFDLE